MGMIMGGKSWQEPALAIEDDEVVRPSFSMEVAGLLKYVTANCPEKLEADTLGHMLMDCARTSFYNNGDPKRPPYFQLAVPEDWVKNVKGDSKFQDVYVMVRIPIEELKKWKEATKVVTPTQAEIKQASEIFRH